MIPKLAWFHWSPNGPEMSWLRQAGIESFRKHNPEWECNLLDTPQEFQLPGMGVSHEADWTCWHTLATEGGVFIDTDIIHIAPIPDEYLDCELLAQTSTTFNVFQFGVIGSVVGNKLMVDADKRCSESVKIFTPVGWSTFGVPLLKGITQNNLGHPFKQPIFGKLYDMPTEAFCFYDWKDDVDDMWMVGGPYESLPASAIGVHWYGGHYASRELERQAVPDGESWIERLASGQI